MRAEPAVKQPRRIRFPIERVVATAFAVSVISAAVVLGIACQSELSGKALRAMQLGEYELGDSGSTDFPNSWRRSWDCKESGCAPGEARPIDGPPCLSGRCFLERIYDDTNRARDSVGISDFHSCCRGDGYGEAANREGTVATYEWKVRFGEGFPTKATESSFVNVTEWHPTQTSGFAQSPPLRIQANAGRLAALSGGWNGSENVSTLWSCTLAQPYAAYVWYTLRVHVRWSATNGAVDVQLDDPRTAESPDKTCARPVGTGGTLYMDKNRKPDEVYLVQNLYRSGDYSRDMTVWYDEMRQVCSRADDGDC